MRVETFDNITLYNADCRDIAPAAVYQSIITDPPYGMAFRSNYRAVKHEAIANDGDVGMLQWTCALPAAHSKYIFCRWDNLADVPKPKSLITWVKNNWSMGDLNHEHGRQTEVALFYPGAEHFFPNGRPSDVVRAPRTGNEDHPTQKPVELMEQVTLWTDGTVFDPNAGLPTTTPQPPHSSTRWPHERTRSIDLLCLHAARDRRRRLPQAVIQLHLQGVPYGLRRPYAHTTADRLRAKGARGRDGCGRRIPAVARQDRPGRIRGRGGADAGWRDLARVCRSASHVGQGGECAVLSENVEWISLPKRLTFGMRVALEIAIERHADDVDRIYRELLDFAPNPPETEYERGRKAVLDAITCKGADGEIYNSYVGGTDLREFLR